MNLDALLIELERRCTGEPCKRLLLELQYARRVSYVDEGRYDALLDNALKATLERIQACQVLTMADVKEIEELLTPMKAACKQYDWIFVGHAHIDMNWMWPYHETVSITLNTFRTVLKLMEAHPGFTFAQSQASTYAMVEEYEPAMLEEIKKRIREGRWEVTASEWVEPDHNMLSLESEIRHGLYTRKYLTKLLDIPEETLDLGFVPDTFGHNSRLPDVLSAAGVRYFYHCRGEEETGLYRWQGKAGELLAYCEQDWYCCNNPYSFAHIRVPEFCKKYNMPMKLTVYGVGDHGGGPTNRDLYRIEDWMTWPIFPNVRYGTMKEFYAAAEKVRETLPVLTGERNMIFSGCYTTQTRIKRGNAMAERLLYKSELFSALAKEKTGFSYPYESNEKAWIKVLFNHFHDIIPGSCKVDTREFALGEYQKVYAAAGSSREAALNALAARMDTSAITTDIPRDDRSEGGGVGFDVGDYNLMAVSRGAGDTRIFHLFNAQPREYKGNVELIVWDYAQDPTIIQFKDTDGHVLPHQLITEEHNSYWGHDYARMLVSVTVPACGYTTIVLCKNPNPEMKQPFRLDPRQDRAFSMVLENDCVRVEFDPHTGRVVRFLDKKTETVCFTDGGFNLVAEGTTEGYSAWRVGRYMQVENAGTHAQIVRDIWGDLRKSFKISVPITANSKLEYTVSLDKGSSHIVYDVLCDWNERGDRDRFPQLQYAASLSEAPKVFTYRNAGGEIDRASMDQDQCSLGGIRGGEGELLCDSRYGYRGNDRTISVTLIRSSNEPDILPEVGLNRCRLAMGLTEGDTLTGQIEQFCQPVDFISGTTHQGDLPLTHSFFSLEEGDAEISGVKLTEKDGMLSMHISNRLPEEQIIRLRFDHPVRIQPADLQEHAKGEWSKVDSIQTISMPAHAVLAYRVK